MKNDSSKLNNKAHQIESTLKPVTSLPANTIISAFTIKRKSPKVIMVMGNVRMIRMGFTKKLSRESISATSKAVVNLSTETPGKK
jgi:hypothetical protein